MTARRHARGHLVVAFLVVVVGGCSTETGTRDSEGRRTPVGAPTATASSTPTGATVSTPTVTPPARPAAVTTELDELARNLRDLSRADSSRDSMPAVASALAATRADLKKVRAVAYGAAKSCSAVESALSSARSNAARTAAAAAAARSRNEVRSTLLTRARATLGRLSAATTTGGRTPPPDETAALAAARTTLEGAADQIAGTAATASSAVASAQELRASGETIAARAC